MAGGNPAGPSSPTQPARSKSATPCSCAVGTSGKNGVRVAVETASTRTRPVCICGMALAVLVQPTGRWPATTSFINCPPERYWISGVSIPVAPRQLLADEGGQRLGAAGADLAGIGAGIVHHGWRRSAKGCAVPATSTMVFRAAGDRGEVGQRVEGQLRQVVAVDDVGRDHGDQRMAVRFRPGDDLGADDAGARRPGSPPRPDAAARPQRLGDRARQQVGPAAGGIGDDQPDRPGRPGRRLRQRHARRDRRGGSRVGAASRRAAAEGASERSSRDCRSIGRPPPCRKGGDGRLQGGPDPCQDAAA